MIDVLHLKDNFIISISNSLRSVETELYRIHMLRTLIYVLCVWLTLWSVGSWAWNLTFKQVDTITIVLAHSALTRVYIYNLSGIKLSFDCKSLLVHTLWLFSSLITQTFVEPLVYTVCVFATAWFNWFKKFKNTDLSFKILRSKNGRLWVVLACTHASQWNSQEAIASL